MYDRGDEDVAINLRARLITSKGVQLPDLRLDATYFAEDEAIILGDIHIFGKNQNEGFGTILLQELIKIAQQLKVTTIAGWISTRDWDHIDRLKHFYIKNEFSLELNEKEQSGIIFWGRKRTYTVDELLGLKVNVK